MNTQSYPGDSLSFAQRISYIIILGALTALGPFTIDLYLPALPEIQEAFKVSPEAVQLTLSGTILGFALGQLIVGPLSDRFGRKTPLLAATVLHIVASILVSQSDDITELNIFRILQGFGAAASGVVSMAMVRDLFGGRPLVKMLSRLALVNGLAPILAPVIGSQLLTVMDWPGLFYFLASYGAVVLVAAIFFIKETLPKELRGEKRRVIDGYKSLFSDRVFVGAALVGGLSFSGLFAYLSASSFLFQTVYQFNAQEYGLLFAVNSIGVVIGTQSASRLTKYIGPQWILGIVTAVQAVAAATIVILDSMQVGLWGILIPLWIYIAAIGFGFPCVQVLALMNHGHEAGTAASLLGAINFTAAGFVAPIVGMLGVGNAVPMGSIMLVTALLAIISVWFVIRPKTVPSLDS